MICLNCGVEFEPKRKDSKFHTPKCRLEYTKKSAENAPKGSEKQKGITNHSDDDYDPEKALEAFKKMGLDPVSWITTGIAEFDELTKIPRGRVTQIQGPYAVGKGQPIDAIIPLANGKDKRMGDLVPGDEVIGSNGKPTKVLDVYDRGKLPTYLVVFSDKSSLEVDGDHLWHLRTPIFDTRSPLHWNTISTKELYDKGVGKYRLLPMVEPVEYPKQDLAIKPYTMGALLADGWFSNPEKGIWLGNRDEEFIDLVRQEGYRIIPATGHYAGARWFVDGVASKLEKMGLIGKLPCERFIPKEYLKGSVAQRKALLAGLLDGDATLTPGGGALYYTTSPALCEDVRELVRSLGGTVSVSFIKQGKLSRYHIRVSLIFNPFRISRKADLYMKRGYPFRRLTSITKTGEEKEIRCIRVDAPDNLYVASREYVVTHNTTLALNMIKGLRDEKVFYVDSEASLNPHLLVQLRLKPENFTLWNKSAYLEDIHEAIYEAAKSGKYDMIVFDSLAACTTRTEAEGHVTDSNIGQKAKIVNKMMRILPTELKEHGTALVIINQEREVIGGYVPQKYTPGGMGVPYAASLMIALKTIKSWRFGRTVADTKKGIFIGHEVEATIIKSKVGKPWTKARFRLYYPDPITQEDSDVEPQF